MITVSLSRNLWSGRACLHSEECSPVSDPLNTQTKKEDICEMMLKGVNDCSKPTAGCLTCELSPYCVSILKHKLFRPSRIECRSRQKSRFSGYISGVLHSSHSWDQNLWKVSSGKFAGQKVTESMTYKHIRTNEKMAEKHKYWHISESKLKKIFFCKEVPRWWKDTQLLVILKCEKELDEERVFEYWHQISLSFHVLDFVLLYNMAFL